LLWTLSGLVLFGIAFGFVEAVVVVDLRAILDPLAGHPGGVAAHGGLPMIAFEQLERTHPAEWRLMRIEVLREAATLILLAGVGLAAGRTFMQRFSGFVLVFGTWDLCYYLSLKLLLGWPASLETWDVLFLIPVPWAAPVAAPIVVASSMVLAGMAVLMCASTGRPIVVSSVEWTAIVAGGLILVVSFCQDWRNLAAGGAPNPFPWPLFLAGEAIAVGGFLHASWATRVAHATVPEGSPARSHPRLARGQDL
jgi:hypothetical protein